MQLDQGEKGFSFQKEGPLDMRMDQRDPLTAEEVVNRFSEKQLQEIIRDLGGEPRWRRAARAIVEGRRRVRITNTKQLADLLAGALVARTRGKLHPATLAFQGLRIYVNRELESIKEGLSKALESLAPGGRLGVISFHSLEDRIVKEVFRAAAAPLKKPFSKEAFHTPLFRLLTKKPLVPSPEECRKNPRARSAKLRFIEKTISTSEEGD
jgi:16S rRNA (cytosine1402-N4)-methyltransferase